MPECLPPRRLEAVIPLDNTDRGPRSEATMVAARFPEHERRVLLRTPGIGERVVQRLERAGFHSLQALREVGATRAAERVLLQLGEPAWLNRRRAIERALRHAAETV